MTRIKVVPEQELTVKGYRRDWMTKVAYAIYTLLGIAAYSQVSNMDFEDALNQERHYCQMVKTGAWPDYKEIYNEECDPGSTEKTAKAEGS